MARRMDAYSADQEEMLEAPRVPRQLRLWRYQWIGIPLMMLIPVLALLGVFGESSREQNFSKNQIELRLSSPERMRYKQSDNLVAEIKNTSNQRREGLRFIVDSKYITRFGHSDFTPEIKRPYEVEIPALDPGESFLVTVELEAGEYGSAKGRLKLMEKNQPLLETPLETFVFP